MATGLLVCRTMPNQIAQSTTHPHQSPSHRASCVVSHNTICLSLVRLPQWCMVWYWCAIRCLSRWHLSQSSHDDTLGTMAVGCPNHLARPSVWVRCGQPLAPQSLCRCVDILHTMDSRLVPCAAACAMCCHILAHVRCDCPQSHASEMAACYRTRYIRHG